MKIIIFDTSAIITAITGNQNFTQDLLLLAHRGVLKIVASKETIAELKTVLKYPKIKERVKLELRRFLEMYLQSVELVDVPKTTKSLARGSTKDPKDDMYIALSEYSKADYLVSLDRKHLVSLKSWKKTKIVLPPTAILNIAKDFGFEWTQEKKLSEWWLEVESKILSQEKK